MIEFKDTKRRDEYQYKVLNVILDKQYTIREFIDTILSERPNEWGRFKTENIENKFLHHAYTTYYEKGYLKPSPNSYFPRGILDKVIKSVTARTESDFNHIDYDIEIDLSIDYYIKDKVGGVHTDGIGVSPAGYQCGECAAYTCEDCPRYLGEEVLKKKKTIKTN